jgi:hypothetical protein
MHSCVENRTGGQMNINAAVWNGIFAMQRRIDITRRCPTLLDYRYIVDLASKGTSSNAKFEGLRRILCNCHILRYSLPSPI